VAIGPACSHFPAVSNAPLGTVVSVAGDGVYRVAGHANSKTGVIFWLVPLQGQESAIALEYWKCRVVPVPLESYPPLSKKRP
jgi:hypothetical protein